MPRQSRHAGGMRPVTVPERRKYTEDAYNTDLEAVRRDMREEYQDSAKQVASPLEAACWKQIQKRDSEEAKWKQVHGSSSGRWAKARASLGRWSARRGLRRCLARHSRRAASAWRSHEGTMDSLRRRVLPSLSRRLTSTITNINAALRGFSTVAWSASDTLRGFERKKMKKLAATGQALLTDVKKQVSVADMEGIMDFVASGKQFLGEARGKVSEADMKALNRVLDTAAEQLGELDVTALNESLGALGSNKAKVKVQFGVANPFKKSKTGGYMRDTTQSPSGRRSSSRSRVFKR
jgi:hypothetical protein